MSVKFSCYFLYDKMIIIVWSIAKNHRNSFWHTIFQMTYTMHNILLFTCIMIMISNSIISFIFSTFIFMVFFTNISDFCVSYGSFCSFVKNFTVFFLKSIGVIACFLYTRCLLSMSLNYNIGDIEKPEGKCSLIFTVDGFWELFLSPSTFSIKDSRSA